MQLVASAWAASSAIAMRAHVVAICIFSRVLFSPFFSNKGDLGYYKIATAEATKGGGGCQIAFVPLGPPKRTEERP